MASPKTGSKAGGDALRAWRLNEPKKTLAACGDLLAVEHSTWSQWESATRMPTLEKALEIERVTQGTVRVEVWGYPEDVIAKLRGVIARRDIAAIDADADPAPSAIAKAAGG